MRLISDTFPVPGLLVTATGTSAGKTVVSRALTLALRSHFATIPLRIVALKPVETGCSPDPLDALALARACGQPELAHARGLYRAGLPLAPHAATLAGEPAPPGVAELAATCRALAIGADFALIEGAGGLLVPLDAEHSIADLAVALAIPVLLVAPDQLGVLSHALTALESAAARGLRVLGVILVQQAGLGDDPSPASNHALLASRTQAQVLRFPHLPASALDDDSALSAAARHSGLLDLALTQLS
jgi:dethiobiotin synthase